MLDSNTLMPIFRQDLDSIRFFWDEHSRSSSDFDDGGKPEFLLNTGESLNLLMQTSKNSTVIEDDNLADNATSYRPVELYIFDHAGKKYEVSAKINPNEFGLRGFQFSVVNPDSTIYASGIW